MMKRILNRILILTPLFIIPSGVGYLLGYYWWKIVAIPVNEEWRTLVFTLGFYFIILPIMLFAFLFCLGILYSLKDK